MAEYRRFISYIYAYEGDMKTKNVGFAKIEARGGQCRISVSIKGAYECSGRELNLYGYGNLSDSFLLVPLGRIPVRNGVGEAVFGKQEDDLSGSGFGLDFVRGLYLRSQASARKSYLTTWDDAIIHISSLREAPVAGEDWRGGQGLLLKAAEAAGRQPDDQIDDHGLDEMELLEAGPEREEPEETGAEEAESEELRPEEPKLEEPRLEEAESEEPRLEEAESEEPRLEEAESEEPELGETELEEMKPETADSTEQEPEEAQPEPEEDMVAGMEEPEDEVEMTAVEEAETEAAVSAEVSELLETYTENEPKAPNQDEEQSDTFSGRMPDDFYYREGFMELPLWDCLKKVLPRKRILAEEGWEVLQIHLQDIGRLPKENWPYGNNSFVLHGYYQYRYLILARRKRVKREKFQTEYQYILGVPGIFKPQEKFMASMFGLPDFKKATGRREENFGFWCGSIQL
ncbi:hypothetical protein [Qiania dongpingensis]|uniref:Uncharacterized protein n=1 Tax=Qiania dongpingensis TaxID=2763669 RepID=A0A7G9G0S7_9FIRM|nr:hypothetical protein [Qiania dongpingensis]QNM04409.1 hypothetical protein H9Q78_07865 [Qiania dongpingensis]